MKFRARSRGNRGEESHKLQSLDVEVMDCRRNRRGASCSGACLYNYDVDSALTSSSTATAGLAVTSGASGTIIDNATPSGTMAGASQIYFYSLAAEGCPSTSSGCAVQASQAGLQ